MYKDLIEPVRWDPTTAPDHVKISRLISIILLIYIVVIARFVAIVIVFTIFFRRIEYSFTCVKIIVSS